MAQDLRVPTESGARMRLRVDGEGPWTVLLDAGWGHWSPVWRAVQDGLAERYRTIAIDRLGLGGSEDGPRPRTGYQVVDELQDALRSAELEGPYLYVGHGFGGVHGRIHAHRDGEVRGLVLVDPIVEVLARSRAFLQIRDALDAQLTQRARWCQMGLWRALALFGRKPVESRRLPPPARRELRSGYSATAIDTMRAELGALEESLAELATVGAPRVPCRILSASEPWLGLPDAGATETAVQAMHRKLAGQSPDGAHQVVERTSHWVHIDRPDAIIDAVNDLAGRVTLPASPSRVSAPAPTPPPP
jgi:pimeloyl-ACP methyl ester carboxylesterase